MGSLNDIINGKENRTKKSGMKRGTSVMIPIEKLMPNEDNKRSFGDRETRNIDVLAEELLISKKVLQNLVVRNTELKDYRSAIEKMCLIFLSADQSGVAKITGREDYASEVANMLLRYRKSRQFVGKNTAMNIFLNRRVLITRYIDGASKEIQFSHAGFFDTFCEVYREEIIGQVQEQEESDQMAIDDYDEDDPYEQIIPEKGSCDGKCFNCRNTECSDHVEKSDKCIYFDKIDCTIKYVFHNLKKDFPDMYKECTGCCMTCSVSESCGYACGRKDMSIVKERAGIPKIKADDEKTADIFAVPKEEEVAAIKSMMTHVTINLVYLILKNNHDYKCNIEEIKDCIVSLKAERKPEKTEYAKHPCWTKAEYMGHGKYKVTYVFRELTNVREIMYDIYTVAELLHRAIAIGYFGNDDEMKFVRKHPCDEEIEQFVDSYSDWNCWIEISEIGAVFYRCRLEDETQIVAAEYRNILDLGCDVVYYYIPRFSELDHGFNSYKMTKDSIIEKLMR